MLVRYFQRRGIYYGWVVVGVMFVTLFVSMGFRFSFGVFYSAILDETGWQRAETASVFSVAMLVYAVTAALSGFLFDRWGARALFTLGALLMGGGLLLCSTITGIGELILYYGLPVGLSYACLGFIPHMAIVPRWFTRRRGLAASLALAGVGVGSLVLAWGSAELIQALGWRPTLWWFGLGCVAVLVPVNLLHRPSAAAEGLPSDGVPHAPDTPPPAAPHHSSVRAAVRSWPFWALFAGVFLMGVCMLTLVVHQTRLLVDLGFGLGTASVLFGLLGLARAVGGMFWGPLSDRIGRALCVVIICSASSLGLGLLLLAANLPLTGWEGLRLALLAGYLATFGLGYNGISPVFAATVSDHFSGRHLGTLFGLIDLGFGVGSALGPWVAGWMFDRLGNYNGVILFLMAGVALTIVPLGLAGRRPRAHP
jgi:MFS family permease